MTLINLFSNWDIYVYQFLSYGNDRSLVLAVTVAIHHFSILYKTNNQIQVVVEMAETHFVEFQRASGTQTFGLV